MERVENVKRPLKIGELFIVPCIIKDYLDTGEIEIIPVLNYPHSDFENGQKDIHYHIDYRFYDANNSYFKNRDYIKFSYNIRPQNNIDGKFDRFVLPVVSESFGFRTDVSLIKNSKLKHKCIRKGKCPHRGMDLSQVSPIDGIITCPLHSLKFDAETKQLIEN